MKLRLTSPFISLLVERYLEVRSVLGSVTKNGYVIQLYCVLSFDLVAGPWTAFPCPLCYQMSYPRFLGMCAVVRQMQCVCLCIKEIACVWLLCKCGWMAPECLQFCGWTRISAWFAFLEWTVNWSSIVEIMQDTFHARV